MKLRGPGEFFGTKQHGMPELRIANPVNDFELLEKARDEAFKLIEDDPQLIQPENGMIRDHFETNYQDKVELIRVG